MPRLPRPGGDAGNWGEILNDFLAVEHNADGSLKHSALTAEANARAYTDSQLAPLAPVTPGEVVIGSSAGPRAVRLLFPAVLFGAVFDGTTDDTAAINAAIAAASAAGGGEVRLPAGTALAAGIKLQTGVTLRGAGRGRTRLTLLSNATTSLLQNDDTTNGNQHLAVYDLELDGNAAGQTAEFASCIAFQHVTGFALAGLWTHDAKQSGINLQWCADGSLHDCILERAGNDNLLIFNRSADITVVSVVSRDTQGGLSGSPNCCGFEVGDDSRNVSFVGCHAEGNYSDGFGVNNHGTPLNSTGPYDVTFTGCTARNNQANGFHVFSQSLTGPRGVTLAGCTATGNMLDGFRIEETAPDLGVVELTGCIARANGRDGFSGVGIDELTLDGCTATDNTRYGFNLPSGVNTAQVSTCRAYHNAVGFVIAGDDGTFTGCLAQANTGTGQATGAGFSISGNRHQFVGCRALGQTNASTGQGFDVSGGAGHQFTGCVATGNSRDGLLLRAINHITVTGGRYATNSTNGIRSLAGSDSLQVLGVQALGNTSAQITLDAGGTNNIAANNVTA